MTSPILRYFTYEHLQRGELRETSRSAAQLAVEWDRTLPPGPEKSTALRKLLEAKDAAVRARLGPDTDATVAAVHRLTEAAP